MYNKSCSELKLYKGIVENGLHTMMLNVSDVDVLIIGGGEASWRRAGDFVGRERGCGESQLMIVKKTNSASIDTLSLSPQQFLQQPSQIVLVIFKA